MSTFAVAALVFLGFWLVRAALGRNAPRPESEPSNGPPPLPEPAGAQAYEASSAEHSPYSPPNTHSASPVTTAIGGLAARLKVRVDHYKPIDLPLIGLVFLLYFGLTSMSGGSDDAPVEEKLSAPVLIASIFFQLLLMGMAMSFVAWRVRLTDWLGLRWRYWPLAFAIAPVTVFFMWCFMGTLHISGWNGWLEQSLGIESMQEAVKLLQEAKDPVVVALMAVAAVLVAPVAEEVVFRGYLYPAAKRFCGPAGAIAFSSLVFAAAHGNVVALLPLFALAVVLCLLYEFTGSIWACISVHFLFNAATVTLQLLARSGVIDIPATE
jgi:membrane protease YdiL (CAAX protease family)